MEVWEEDEFEELLDLSQMLEQSQDRHLLVKWICYFLVLLQGKHYIPDAAISLLVLFLATLFTVLSKMAPQLSGLSRQFPTSIYTLHQVVSAYET